MFSNNLLLRKRKSRLNHSEYIDLLSISQVDMFIFTTGKLKKYAKRLQLRTFGNFGGFFKGWCNSTYEKHSDQGCGMYLAFHDFKLS